MWNLNCKKNNQAETKQKTPEQKLFKTKKSKRLKKKFTSPSLPQNSHTHTKILRSSKDAKWVP